jgi:hypothetical protein
MKKEYYSFKSIKEAFLKKYPNGKIEKINGGVNVIFDIKKGNPFGYNYKGNNDIIVKKLNLEILEDKEKEIKEKLDTEIENITLRIELELLNLVSKYEKEKEFNCTINSGEIIIENHIRKLYQSKKGMYFILKGKRLYIDDLKC